MVITVAFSDSSNGNDRELKPNPHFQYLRDKLRIRFCMHFGVYFLFVGGTSSESALRARLRMCVRVCTFMLNKHLTPQDRPPTEEFLRSSSLAQRTDFRMVLAAVRKCLLDGYPDGPFNSTYVGAFPRAVCNVLTSTRSSIFAQVPSKFRVKTA